MIPDGKTDESTDTVTHFRAGMLVEAIGGVCELRKISDPRAHVLQAADALCYADFVHTASDLLNKI